MKYSFGVACCLSCSRSSDGSWQVFSPVLAGESITIGCSIGATLWTGGEFADALAQADEALYRAKRAGKSQAQFHDASLTEISDTGSTT